MRRLASWFPALIVGLLVLPATALAAEGNNGDLALFVQLLIAAGVAVLQITVTQLRAKIADVDAGAAAGVRGPAGFRSAAGRIATVDSPRLQALESRVGALEGEVRATNTKLTEVQADLHEVLRLLGSERHA